MVKKGELVPYELVSPGFEGVYQGTKDKSALANKHNLNLFEWMESKMDL